MDRFKFLAQFGNPSVDNTEDWIPTIAAEAAAAVRTAGEVDAVRNSCTLVTALEVEIMTSQMGYIDNLQKYIVGAQVTPIKTEWVFEAESVNPQPQDFSLYVSVAYTEILPKELEASGYLSFALIKGNLFYPFEIKSGAVIGVAEIGAVTVAVIAGLMLV